MPVAQDFQNGVRAGLSAVNAATLLGATNATWSSNATGSLVKTALRALAQVSGGSPDMVEKVCRNLQLGINSGAMAETHGVTTIAGAQALFTAVDPSLPSTYTAGLLD